MNQKNRRGAAVCQLDNNRQITRYDAACLLGKRVYDPSKFNYIGDGVVYSVGGTLQKGTERLSFFTLKRKKKYSGLYSARRR